ncbi:hypothetical protein AVEN_2036-1 [Araneus ventricosus]|uniref:Uncharacterized protein n=1 Tax=Araneus ventricosus TaxID=182803 RepID=A0A4Y1ZQL0_ARAVE|nr:hypothetical protein AVEN_2036-1 [Araneus ventricosus]
MIPCDVTSYRGGYKKTVLGSQVVCVLIDFERADRLRSYLESLFGVLSDVRAVLCGVLSLPRRNSTRQKSVARDALRQPVRQAGNRGLFTIGLEMCTIVKENCQRGKFISIGCDLDGDETRLPRSPKSCLTRCLKASSHVHPTGAVAVVVITNPSLSSGS